MGAGNTLLARTDWPTHITVMEHGFVQLNSDQPDLNPVTHLCVWPGKVNGPRRTAIRCYVVLRVWLLYFLGLNKTNQFWKSVEKPGPYQIHQFKVWQLQWNKKSDCSSLLLLSSLSKPVLLSLYSALDHKKKDCVNPTDSLLRIGSADVVEQILSGTWST